MCNVQAPAVLVFLVLDPDSFWFCHWSGQSWTKLHVYRLGNVRNWCHVFPIAGTFMISSSENMLNMPSRLGMLFRLHDCLGLCQYSIHIPLGVQILRYLKHLICRRKTFFKGKKKKKRTFISQIKMYTAYHLTAWLMFALGSVWSFLFSGPLITACPSLGTHRKTDFGSRLLETKSFCQHMDNSCHYH